MGLLFGIGVVVVVLVAGAVWLFRLRARQQAETAQALERLAATLGTTYVPRKIKKLEGAYGGRACSISEAGTYGTKGTQLGVRIRVPIETGVSLELLQQKSALAARLVNDVEIGDAEFDKWFIVRTNDLDRVKRALTPDLRRRLVEWLRGGWLDRVYIKDGQLTYEGGRRLELKGNIEKSATILAEVVRLAGQLE